jgi:lysyl oxidase
VADDTSGPGYSLRAVRVRLFVSAAAAIAALTLSAAAAGAAPAPNPCEGPEAKHLLCPNLRIGPPSDLYVDAYDGRVRLHATSDVRSRGRGPMELRGHRNGPKSMRVVQRIYKAGGGHINVRTEATLHFTDVGYYFGGSYWKVHQLARFELRRANADGAAVGPVVRTSPKLNYCLRDLERTRPGKRSPATFHYPGCNQDRSIQRDVLGTSVGWSDIYPADYDKQWINVTGLRGCFVFSMTVDPKRLLFESNENDNTSHRLVRLPYTGAPGC